MGHLRVVDLRPPTVTLYGMGPRDQNRPDGYPIDEKFDEAASRVLKDRRDDEKKADDFFREMDKRLRAAQKKG